jgi:acyl-CoA reductase-like NAD-dependent aldehyde dehydrogenase
LSQYRRPVRIEIAPPVLTHAAVHVRPLPFHSLFPSLPSLRLAAKRTLTYKLMNLGQTCTSVDYVLLPPSLQQPYIDACLALLTEWFPDPTLGELVSDAKIPTQGMIDRLERLLDGTKGRIVRRGKVDREGMKMGVSIVADVEEGDILLNEKEEIFGPILVIVRVTGVSRFLHAFSSCFTES